MFECTPDESAGLSGMAHSLSPDVAAFLTGDDAPAPYSDAERLSDDAVLALFNECRAALMMGLDTGDERRRVIAALATAFGLEAVAGNVEQLRRAAEALGLPQLVEPDPAANRPSPEPGRRSVRVVFDVERYTSTPMPLGIYRRTDEGEQVVYVNANGNEGAAPSDCVIVVPVSVPAV